MSVLIFISLISLSSPCQNTPYHSLQESDDPKFSATDGYIPLNRSSFKPSLVGSGSGRVLPINPVVQVF